ncbi:MAG TPA: hypothetical protein VHZ75_10345 [Solirubrobacteraceae bacterium]|nr:hypothetical protein [Solirubrobacteraceae bacterium]
MMVLILNAVLYAVALVLSLGVLRTASATDSRRVRTTRIVLVCGGGLAVGTAIVLSFLGRWLASGVAGCVAIVIVATCLGIALSSRSTQRRDDDDDDQPGGGGPRRRPEPPAPTEPAGGPSDDLWSQFDRARAIWEQEREPAGR